MANGVEQGRAEALAGFEPFVSAGSRRAEDVPRISITPYAIRFNRFASQRMPWEYVVCLYNEVTKQFAVQQSKCTTPYAIRLSRSHGHAFLPNGALRRKLALAMQWTLDKGVKYHAYGVYDENNATLIFDLREATKKERD